MRRNYILFHFPWVWLNLQRQKASLEVPGDWKKKKKKNQPPNWESETAHPHPKLPPREVAEGWTRDENPTPKKGRYRLGPRAGRVSTVRVTRPCSSTAPALRCILACCGKPCHFSRRTLAADLFPRKRASCAATGLLTTPLLSPSAGEPEQQRKAQGEEYSGAHWKKKSCSH